MSAAERIRLLALVEQGYRPAHATTEGPAYDVATGDLRWFQDNIPCQAACPAHTDVPRYIALLADGRYAESEALNREQNLLPGCLGRICARPCEAACRRGLVDAPVSICSLKRAAYDWSPERVAPPATGTLPLGKSVGIVGAGPSGLAAARELARQGYAVVIYEQHRVPGGMLWAGIPAWRLPREVIRDEVQEILDLGVTIRYGARVGRDRALADLLAEHDALLLAVGCQDSVRLGIPGEELDGVAGGLVFLEAANLGQGAAERWRGKRVVTIGGGYTSLDCARTALRLGATESVLAYRRSAADMPVEADEREEAVYEGVGFRYLVSPLRILGAAGRVTGVEFETNRLVAQPGGKTKVEPVPGANILLPCDGVIVAIGQRTRDDLGLAELLGDACERGVPRVDERFRTAHPRVWATGDFVARPRNVISAIADGKAAAAALDAALRGVVEEALAPELVSLTEPGFGKLRDLLAEGVADWSLATLARRVERDDDYLAVPRREMPRLRRGERGLGTTAGLTVEVDRGFAPALAADEAQRCLQCQLNIFIDGNSCILCNGCVEVCPQQCIEMVPFERLRAIDGSEPLAREARAALGDSGAAMLLHEAACVRCGRCVERCPTGCLTMEHFRALPAAGARGLLGVR